MIYLASLSSLESFSVAIGVSQQWTYLRDLQSALVVLFEQHTDVVKKEHL